MRGRVEDRWQHLKDSVDRLRHRVKERVGKWVEQRVGHSQTTGRGGGEFVVILVGLQRCLEDDLCLWWRGWSADWRVTAVEGELGALVEDQASYLDYGMNIKFL